MPPGTLFVVATPIGNLEDFSFRGVRTLKEVDLIAAEDTRRTAKLLAHYDIQKPLVSLREHNEHREGPRLVERIKAGSSIALVSDAGTPGIADPGAMFVHEALEAGIKVTPIPGPSAITAALSASGMPGDQFVFLGFPPPSGADRERWFESAALEKRTVVFYEAPHRISRTLADSSEYLAQRPICIFRELSKVHEELVIWANNTSFREDGEFVVVVGPAEIGEPSETGAEEVADLFGRITEISNLSEEEVVGMVSHHFKISGPRTRNLVKKGRILKKQRLP
jgi:16S rRNA (cytidine1402-2'-O)-methyltransferase